MRLPFIFVGSDYPWRGAPQQSPLPFRPNNAKFNIPNYIYNLSKKPATFQWKSMRWDFFYDDDKSKPYKSFREWYEDVKDLLKIIFVMGSLILIVLFFLAL